MMNKTIVIDYDEYMNLYSLVDSYRDEVKKIKETLRERDTFISNIKEKAEEVVVITNNEKGEEYSFKSKDKKVLSDVIKLYSELQDKMLKFREEMIHLEHGIKNSDDLLFKEHNQGIALENENKLIKKELKFYKDMNFFERLLNKEYEK